MVSVTNMFNRINTTLRQSPQVARTAA
jgi:hypothetical protein